MTAEGYPGRVAASEAGPSNLGTNTSLAVATPSGGEWGYIGAAGAQQYGFLGPSPT
jgi:hypothetical protein